MIENETVKNILSDQKRRDVLKKGAALTGADMLPSIFAGKAFAAGKPKEVVLVYWTVDGDESVVKRVFAEYQKDHGIRPRWERTPNIEEYMQKVYSMSVADEQMDVIPCHYYNLAKWVKEGIIQPIDGMPGLDGYLSEMNPSVRNLCTYDGKVWGLPYFLSLHTNCYNTQLWDKTGFSSLPNSWYELGEMSKKAKADGVCKYPIVFQAGVGSEHIGDTLYALVASIDGEMFDKDWNPLFDEGSKARKMLRWWRSTIQDWKIADPRSLELRWIPAIKAQATGDYIFSQTQERFMNFAQDKDKSPTAGMHKIFKMGRHSFGGHLWCLASTASDKKYSTKFFEYIAGKTDSGEYMMSVGRIKTSGSAGWPEKALAVPENIAITSKRYDMEEYARQWVDSKFLGTTVPAMLAPWYVKWVDTVYVPNLQKCLGGQISADQACGNMARGAEKLNG